MEPVTTTTILTVLLAAGKEVAKKAIKDAYEGFKSLLIRKLGGKADVEGALMQVEKNPDSEARHAVLKEDLAKAGAAQDAEVVQEARALLELLKQEGIISSQTYQAKLEGSGAIAQGPGAVAAGEGGIVISGDVGGGVQVSGSPTDDPDKK